VLRFRQEKQPHLLVGRRGQGYVWAQPTSDQVILLPAEQANEFLSLVLRSRFFSVRAANVSHIAAHTATLRQRDEEEDPLTSAHKL